MKKKEMFKCASCPDETATCRKLVFDDHTECIDEEE